MHPNYPVTRILTWYDKRVEAWVAQCVDFDLMTQAKTQEDLPKAFGHVYYGEIVASLENELPISFNPVPEWAEARWAQAAETKAESKSIPWTDFVPSWFAEALGNLAKKYTQDDVAQKAEVRLAKAA